MLPAKRQHVGPVGPRQHRPDPGRAPRLPHRPGHVRRSELLLHHRPDPGPPRLFPLAAQPQPGAFDPRQAGNRHDLHRSLLRYDGHRLPGRRR